MIWQPIETAPKDGTLILVYRPTARKTGYMVKVSQDYWWRGKTWGNSNGDHQPTHWMPMPEPPE